MESCHSQIKKVNRKKLTVNSLIEALRIEQSNVENSLTQLNMGEIKKRSNKSMLKDENLFNLCSNYDRLDIGEYLNNISLNLSVDKIFSK